MGLIPGWEIKVPHAIQQDQKNKSNSSRVQRRAVSFLQCLRSQSGPLEHLGKFNWGHMCGALGLAVRSVPQVSSTWSLLMGSLGFLTAWQFQGFKPRVQVLIKSLLVSLLLITCWPKQVTQLGLEFKTRVGVAYWEPVVHGGPPIWQPTTEKSTTSFMKCGQMALQRGSIGL